MNWDGSYDGIFLYQRTNQQLSHIPPDFGLSFVNYSYVCLHAEWVRFVRQSVVQEENVHSFLLNEDAINIIIVIITMIRNCTITRCLAGSGGDGR